MDKIDEDRAAKARGEDPADPKPADPKPAHTPQRNPDGTFKSAADKAKDAKNADPKTSSQAKEKSDPKTPPTPEAKETKKAKASEHDDLETPPSRFSQDAKDAWAKLDPATKGETKRALRELESGLTSYKGKLEPLQEFFDMAEKHGTTVDVAMKNYVGMENLLRANPAEGFRQLAQRLQIPPQQIAQLLMQGQPQQPTPPAPQQGRPQQGQPTSEMQAVLQELAAVKQTLATFQNDARQAQQAQAQQAYQQQVETIAAETADFAAQHPRLEELTDEVVRQINAGYDLPEAYSRAEMLHPAPAPQAQPTPAPTAQTQKSGLSVTGAPVSGSTPDARKTPNSAKEAVKRAFAERL
jgi:hypothetical protein